MPKKNKVVKLPIEGDDKMNRINVKDINTNRLIISTPTLGLFRSEWVNARFSQTIPTNFSVVDVQNFMNPHMPVGFALADAENLSAKAFVEGDFEWFLSIEDDNIIPQGTILKINDYMIIGDTPIVSGLYFTKSNVPEPIMYRGQGKGHYADWKLGEKVWVDGIPFGCTLIHGSIIRALWDISPEYVVNGVITRRVFDNTSEGYIDPVTNGWMSTSGTTDLAFCKKLQTHKIFDAAGWPEFQEKEFPLLVDTTIFVKHIDRSSGVVYPTHLPKEFLEGKITWREALKILTN